MNLFWFGKNFVAYKIQSLSSFLQIGVDGQEKIHGNILLKDNTTSQLYVIVTQLQNLSWKGGKVH